MRRHSKTVTPGPLPPVSGLPPRFTVRRDSDHGADEQGGWRITDGDGEIVVADLDSRRLAIRMMATYATKRPLPLRVEDSAGRPSGDRLG